MNTSQSPPPTRRCSKTNLYKGSLLSGYKSNNINWLSEPHVLVL